VSDADSRARVDAVLDLVRGRNGAVLLCVVGPTASGKTTLAISVAEALGGEIVSADSVQVYRRFDKASGKPTAEESARVPHHLVDVADPLEPFDAARFVALAEHAISDIRARGRIPVICGGTFLWVKALISGLSDAPPGDEAVRARHRAIALAEGREALHALLREVDPVMAERLHPNDTLRVGRALEVFELSGKRLSDLQAAHGFRQARHDALLVTPEREKDELTVRIEARVRGFLDDGLVEEVRALADDGLRDARAMGSVGYKETLAHVDGTLPLSNLHEAIVRASRVFARRQRTWLGHEPVHVVGARGVHELKEVAST
jgi:tRNA dimethylallyltransferase